jgi:hypothetical protein
LYGCFILRNVSFVKDFGFVSMISIPNWMFLSGFEDLRNVLLNKFSLDSLVHNGRGVLGSDFGSCSFIFLKKNISGFVSRFKKLFERSGQVSSSQELIHKFFNKPDYFAKLADLSLIPGAPFSYWISQTQANAFKGDPLSTISISGGRCKTANDEKYLRYFWEVDSSKIGLDGEWCLLSKGGGYRKYYGNREYLIAWSDEAKKYYSTVGGLTKPEFWNRQGVTWTIVTANANTSFRLKESDCQYNSVSPTVFFESNSSSSRSQSWANAGSLRLAPHSAVSPSGASSVNVTNTRRGRLTRLLGRSKNCSCPLGCSTAS